MEFRERGVGESERDTCREYIVTDAGTTGDMYVEVVIEYAGRGASGGEERSDEQKVVSYICRRYVTFAVALLQPHLGGRVFVFLYL